MLAFLTRRLPRRSPHRMSVRLCVEALEDRLTPAISAVPDTTAFPFSAVAELEIDIQGHGLSCTGVLLDSTHVLTSAHCLYDPADGGFADVVDVFAGRNGENVLPFGVAHGTRWVVHNLYVSGPSAGQAAYDIGVITLDRPLGTQTGTFGLTGSQTTSYFDGGGIINILGYPGDTFSGVNQYFSAGPAIDASTQEIHWLLGDLPIEHGSSGSPVYFKDSAGDRFVVGVVSEFTDTQGIATRITASKFNWIVSQLSTPPATLSPPPPAAAPPALASPQGPGVFDPTTGTWYLHTSTTPGAPDIAPFAYGAPGWVPVAGDWNGDGVTTIGVVDSITETWYLKNTNGPGTPDIEPFAYGSPGWIPVVGDWNGSGVDMIGVFDPSTATWYLRESSTGGAPDIVPFAYGSPGWIPVVGDWDGDGVTTIGVVDPTTMTWYLRNSNGPGGPDITPFAYGGADWRPVVADWNGDGRDTIGVIDPSTETWYLRDSNGPGGPDYPPFPYGAPGWSGLGGAWLGASSSLQTTPSTPTAKDLSAPAAVDGGWWMVDGEEQASVSSSPSTIHHPPSTELATTTTLKTTF